MKEGEHKNTGREKVPIYSSTNEVMDKREADTSIWWTEGYIIFMFDKSSPRIWISSGKYMAVINPLINRTCGAI